MANERGKDMDDLATRDGLAAALAAAGSWAGVSRRRDVPASTLKSRGKRLGVTVKAKQADHKHSIRDCSQFSPAAGLSETYFEAMEEYMLNSGFSGYPAHGGMLEFASDLGLDRTIMFQLANRAVELAGEEYNRVMAEIDQIWSDWA